MSKFDQRFEKELAPLKLFTEKLCSDERNKELQEMLASGKGLPAGCRPSDEKEGVFFEQESRDGFSKEEIMSLVQLRQAKDIRTIKNCIAFLTALVGISIVATIVAYVAMTSALPQMFMEILYRMFA